MHPHTFLCTHMYMQPSYMYVTYVYVIHDIYNLHMYMWYIYITYMHPHAFLSSQVKVISNRTCCPSLSSFVGRSSKSPLHNDTRWLYLSEVRIVLNPVLPTKRPSHTGWLLAQVYALSGRVTSKIRMSLSHCSIIRRHQGIRCIIGICSFYSIFH